MIQSGSGSVHVVALAVADVAAVVVVAVVAVVTAHVVVVVDDVVECAAVLGGACKSLLLLLLLLHFAHATQGMCILLPPRQLAAPRHNNIAKVRGREKDKWE